MSRSSWAWLVRSAKLLTSGSKASRRGRRNDKRSQPAVEFLESRELPSTTTFLPDYVLHPRTTTAAPFASNGPTGTTPVQIRTAYGINQISFNGGTVVGDGSGTTIAIVDAYNDPNIAADLDVFDKQFAITAGGPTLYTLYGSAFPSTTSAGTDPGFLTVVNQSGGSSLPANNQSWAEEIALDVEWSHAIAPGAKILLVEASSDSSANLYAADAFAAKQSGVVVVSNSWGGSEASNETSSDSTFTTPAGHAGVTFVFSSGDSGAPPEYPATSPNVLSVGGTTLDLSSSGTIISETGWSGSGGGISADEAQPSYQKGVVTQSTTMRTNPDVAYDADPNTGFPEYNSYSFSTSQAWEQFGGTSDAAPQWAALIAIADQGRASVGLTSLDGRSQTLPMLYSLYQTGDFNDITSGTSTGKPKESAGSGYDLVTGLGTPNANLIVAALVGQSTSNPVVAKFNVAAPAMAIAGSPVTFTVTAETSSGALVSGYTGTVHFTSTDGMAVLAANSTLTAGVGTFTATLKTADNQTITATDASNSSLTGSAAISVSPSAVNSLTFVKQPSNAAPGVAMSSAVTVQELDLYNNVVTSDSTSQMTLALNGLNGATGTLGGPTATATVSKGIATFSSLTVSAAGTYTLTASDGGINATSNSFTISITAVQFSVTTAAPATSTAGSPVTFTVTAETSSGALVSAYTGMVHFTSTDGMAVLPANSTLTAGVGTFTATLKTAGNQTITATDASNSSLTGSAAISVSPGAVNSLAFVSQPTSAAVGAAISPAVTVQELDLYGNVLTNDITSQVTLALNGLNGATGTLGGGTATATVNYGVATFSGLTVSAAGTYTLTASEVGLSSKATSNSFTIASTGSGGTGGSGGGSSGSGTLIEGFESSDMWNIVDGRGITAVRSTAAAHDGTYGLDQFDGNEWIYRSDAAAQVQAGDSLSIWLQFPGNANGRAYFAFGATASGTLSLVAAPNTDQLIIQSNPGYNFINLAAVNQTYQANHWYLLQVQWGTSGNIVGNLYDSNGTTLLSTVSATQSAIMSGGFGFRTTANNAYWDTVTAYYNVNSFATHATVLSVSGSSSAGIGSQTGSGSTTATLSVWSPPASQSAIDQFFAYFSTWEPSTTQFGYAASTSLQWLEWAEALWTLESVR